MGERSNKAASIEPQRLNGLRLHAARDKRSVRNALDLLLEKAGIQRLSDKQLSDIAAKEGLEI